MSTLSNTHEVTRLAFDARQPYEQFRARYEEAVPPIDAHHLDEMVASAATWDEVVDDAAASAPFGFIRYWGADVAPLMRLAGDTWECTTYLMGNHTTAEQMFRHDPSVMLYAPLRTAIYVDAGGSTRLAIDQPGSVFSSFDDPDIAQVGRTLDRELADLLEALGVADR